VRGTSAHSHARGNSKCTQQHRKNTAKHGKNTEKHEKSQNGKKNRPKKAKKVRAEKKRFEKQSLMELHGPFGSRLLGSGTMQPADGNPPLITGREMG
jgi:hypothetical protein